MTAGPVTAGRPRLVLASASPARRRLLADAGVAVQVRVSGVDEPAALASAGLADGADPRRVAAVLAAAKADGVAAGLAREPGGAGALVVGCDSVLALDGRALGRPADAADAVERWRRMRGRTGVLLTGHAVVEAGTGRRAEEVAATAVRFADVDDDEVAAYVATGEPLRVAGAFTVDGLGGAFVDGLDGDPSNVVGLSLPTLRRLLAGLGVRWSTLWR